MTDFGLGDAALDEAKLLKALRHHGLLFQPTTASTPQDGEKKDSDGEEEVSEIAIVPPLW